MQMPRGGIRYVVCEDIDAQSSYRGIRSIIPDPVANRANLEYSGPSPMEVGSLQGEYDEGDAEECFGAMGRGSRE